MEKKIKKTMVSPEVKLTEDEVASCIELGTQYQEGLGDFGQLYLRKIQIEEETERVEELEKEFKTTYLTISQRESDIIDRLTKKYGEGHVDTTRGVYVKVKKSI